MSMTEQLARPEPNYRRWYAGGLVVQGKILTGTLLVDFDAERGVSFDKEAILARMRRVNRRTSEGYAIQLVIREQSLFESWYTSLPVVKVVVLSSMINNKCIGALACFDPNWNVIRLTPAASDLVVVHELFHKLGLGHSGSRRSLMYLNTAGKSDHDVRTFDSETRALVEAYR